MTFDRITIERDKMGRLVAVNAWLVVRLARRGVWASERGLLIRNTLRTYQVPWPETESIEPPLRYGTLRKAGIRIRLHDDSTVSADLFSAGPLSRPTHSDAVLHKTLKGAGTARHAEMQTATPDQVAALVAAVGPDGSLRPGHSGLRWGELAGLRRRDVDREAVRMWADGGARIRRGPES